MCIKRKPPEWDYASKVALVFSINDYPGTANDLSFCVSDGSQSADYLSRLGYQIRQFKDGEVTRRRFREEIFSAFQNAKEGDKIWIDYSGHGSRIPDVDGDEEDGYDETLYLHDGHFSDDEIGLLTAHIPDGVKVIFFMDSCHSGTVTRSMFNGRSRYMPPPHKIWQRKRRLVKLGHRLVKGGLNHAVISACQPHESAYEGMVNGQGGGVLHLYFWNGFDDTLTLRENMRYVLQQLPNRNFPQTPMIEGPAFLLDMKI